MILSFTKFSYGLCRHSKCKVFDAVNSWESSVATYSNVSLLPSRNSNKPK